VKASIFTFNSYKHADNYDKKATRSGWIFYLYGGVWSLKLPGLPYSPFSVQGLERFVMCFKCI
jgi:hypothetical protein